MHATRTRGPALPRPAALLEVAALLVMLAALTPGVAQAQDPFTDWGARIGLQAGPAWVGYREHTGSLESEFDEPGYWVELTLEGNLAGWSPFLRAGTSGASGLERVDGTNDQRTDLRMARVWTQLGLGYRVELGEGVVLVPRVAYAFDWFGFERSRFRVNGVEVVIQGVDGELYREVDETFRSHGVLFGAALEVELSQLVELWSHLSVTYLPRVRVENDLGGTLHSDGAQIRSGVGCTFWLLENLGLSVGTDLTWQLLDKSRVATRRGSVSTTFVQFPYSETINLAFLVGLRARF